MTEAPSGPIRTAARRGEEKVGHKSCLRGIENPDTKIYAPLRRAGGGIVFFLVQRSCTSLSVLTSVSVQKAQPSKETPKRRSCKKEVRRRLRSAVAVPRAHLAQQKAAKGPKRKTDIWRPPAEQLFFLRVRVIAGQQVCQVMLKSYR